MATYSKGIKDMILATLASGRNTRRLHEILNELERGNSKQSVRSTIYRLGKEGYMKESSSGWSITSKGMSETKKTQLLSYLSSPFTAANRANMILAFDIPEKNRRVRNWLRNQLKIFGYKMLQQSLWLGPGPLPVSFMKRLDDLQIRKYVKMFKVTRTKP